MFLKLHETLKLNNSFIFSIVEYKQAHSRDFAEQQSTLLLEMWLQYQLFSDLAYMKIHLGAS